MLIKLIVTSFLLATLTAEDATPEPVTSKYAAPDPQEYELRSPNPQSKPARRLCLTGYMTDVQNWVDEDGNLNPAIDNRFKIDLSFKQDPIQTLTQQIGKETKSSTREVVFLSMSRCNLKSVPPVFNLVDSRSRRALHTTITYLTLYGNDFNSVSAPGVQFDEGMNATGAIAFPDVAIRWPGPTLWSSGFEQVIFQRLRQLDLRKCNIQSLSDNAFENMPELEALYLGENQIAFVSSKAFSGLYNLIHLDISRNFDGYGAVDVVFEQKNVFSDLRKLKSLDFSITLMSQRDMSILKDLHNLERLSVCYAGLVEFPKSLFEESSIKYLDVSGNNGILTRRNTLHGLEDKLEILYAKEVGIKDFELFRNFKQLQVLNLERNDLSSIPRAVTQTLKNLQILNLSNNRINAWFGSTFNVMEKLKFLSLRDNNINVITSEIITDIQNITYIGLSGNFVVCNCHAREFFEIAYRNQNKSQISNTTFKTTPYNITNYHRGFYDFNILVSSRRKLVRYCKELHTCGEDELEYEGNFLLYDYEENLYQCLDVAESKSVPYSQVKVCSQMKRDKDFFEKISNTKTKLIVLIVPAILLFPMLIFCYVFRRNFRYFCISIRNSATLSLINKNKVIDDDAIFNYDVFVSYCNDDRNWVLDELLPNVEKGCNISVCLHERDFQVGLSILENIVSCMDRSRSIMLIISKQFLMSQWCQFEMHLAQHRLLETRREDLILVLLEDIPRSLRPTTLHYLMLTKTYIVWPRKEGDKPAFWKRLSRSILARRHISQNNVSLA